MIGADQAAPATGTEINASDERPSNGATDQAGILPESRVVDAEARPGDDERAPQPQPQPSESHQNSANCEIQQESIKHALHEIISEIDREMEADFANEEVSRLACVRLLMDRDAPSGDGAHAPNSYRRLPYL